MKKKEMKVVAPKIVFAVGDLVSYDDRNDGRDAYAPKVGRVVYTDAGDTVCLKLISERLTVAHVSDLKIVNI